MLKLKRKNSAGTAITVGETTVTPQSQAFTLFWPNGGLVWNRATALQVQRGEETKRIPIIDVTRRAQLTLLGLSLALTIIAFIFTWQSDNYKH